MESDQSKQKELQPLFGNTTDRQDFIFTGSEDVGWFYLPRSSPVISCHQENKKSLITSSNKVFHENTVSKMLQSILPKEQTIPTSSASQVLLFDAHCAPAAARYVKKFHKLRNLACRSLESQSSSCEDQYFVNTGASALEKGTVTCLNKSLISGTEHEEQISEAFYRNSVDLDQENAHFVVVDMVLEVLEAANWDVSQRHSDSFSPTDSGYEEHRPFFKRSFQTLVGKCSAEILAHRLLVEHERWWIFSDELLGEFPLVTVSMASGSKASLSDEIRQKSRMRGTLIWTPPQFQILSTVTPTQRRSEVIASQQFLCAGCGTKIEPRYIKRLRYCDYLGKYFCDCCHGGGEAVIPARVLNHWDLGLYPVCHFSKQLLEFIWEKPLFQITGSLAKNLYSQAKELQKFREIQEQMISIKKLLKACRLSERVLNNFQHFPSHLSEELHLFSMDDLVKIKRGLYLTTAKTVMLSATNHTEACELCQAKGFICEFCRGKDVLFPFQTDICTRCQECRACFHTSCFRDEACPKCVRIQFRRAART